MRLRNVRVSHQLTIGFTVILMIIAILGIFSSVQLGTIHNQTEVMYNHPLQVRRAISTIEIELTHIDLSLSGMINDLDESVYTYASMEESKNEIEAQLQILDDFYLGPKEDVENIKSYYFNWISIQEEVVRLLNDGNFVEAETLLNKEGPNSLSNLLDYVDVVDQFARNKADTLYESSAEIYENTIYQLILIIALIVAFTIGVIYFLIRNLRGPLGSIIDVATAFGEGNKEIRVDFQGKSEFGELAYAMNDMMDKVELNAMIGDYKAELVKKMLHDDDVEPFFNELLKTLMSFIGGQMASAYLVKNNKEDFDCIVSIGMPHDHNRNFNISDYSGEFGLATSTRKWQIITLDTENTVFKYETTAGEYLAKQIVTIPLINGRKVTGVISIATVSSFPSYTEDLINAVIDSINARVESVMTLKTVREVTEKLGIQNSELDIQRMELSTQTEELTKQNLELEYQKEKLNEANQLKTNFLSNMSHELRTPLNSVIALTGVLKRKLNGSIPDKEHSYLEIIERNGKHLLLLINDILDISRIESGFEEISVSKFDINKLIEEVKELIIPQIDENDLKIEHSRSEEELFIESDDDKIKHILQNLMSNAIKFTEQGKIEIEAVQKLGHVVISVKDTGIGIADEHLSHIFDEFRQADGSTSRRFGGTGLGLAIVKKYTTLLGGNIEVVSTLDEGSEFILTLPVSIESKNEVPKRIPVKENVVEKIIEPLQEEKISHDNKTILVVEDSHAAVIQIKEIFEPEGYQVLVAHNGNKAEKILNDLRPDAMILDLMMPIADGFDVIKSSRANEALKDLPILVLTAKQITPEDDQFLKTNRIHKLMQKGNVNEKDLKSAVESMIYPEWFVEKESPKVQPISREKVFKNRDDKEKLKVLVVEDNYDNMVTVKALLGDAYEIHEASDGIAGVLKAQNIMPDLVLMDIALPEIDGIEAFKRIIKIEGLESVPVIALTASVMIEEKESILAHGFDGFVGKPILQEKFYRVIDEVLYGKN